MHTSKDLNTEMILNQFETGMELIGNIHQHDFVIKLSYKYDNE